MPVGSPKDRPARTADALRFVQSHPTTYLGEPLSGSTLGGQLVTIVGEHLSEGSKVTFGDQPADGDVPITSD